MEFITQMCSEVRNTSSVIIAKKNNNNNKRKQVAHLCVQLNFGLCFLFFLQCLIAF